MNHSKPTFKEWLDSKGIEWPNLGVNWPAGDSWGAADNIGRLHRRYRQECEAAERQAITNQLIVVIAATLWEAQDWADKNNMPINPHSRNGWVFVNHPQSLDGLRDVKIVRLPSWVNLPKAREISERIWRIESIKPDPTPPSQTPDTTPE